MTNILTLTILTKISAVQCGLNEFPFVDKKYSNKSLYSLLILHCKRELI